MSLWTHLSAAEATGGVSTGPWSATGVSIDSRTLQPGDLFVALKVARDGHDFVAQALKNGAAAALVNRVPEGVPEDAPLLMVEDVQAALEALGRAARARTDARVIAVTGSVGKTSTKEMLRTVLAGQGRVHAAEASYNNQWGVPLTLARMPADVDFAVIEIGMNHPGEIAPLSDLARPHVAMITTVAPAHLEAFSSLAEIAAEKASVFNGLEPAGVAVFNGDLETTPILREAARARDARLISFGESTGCHHRVTSVQLHETVTVARGRAWRDPVLFKVRAAGRHFVINGMGVLGVVSALGLNRAIAISDLGHWHPGSGRGARVRIVLDPADVDGTLELIDESYNANPVSIAAALEVLAAAPVHDGVGRVARGRRIAVLGDMAELGPTSADLHAALAELPSLQAIDKVHCVGPMMRGLHERLPAERRGIFTETAVEMAKALPRTLDSGDVVMVKGSNSMGLNRVVDAIRNLDRGAVEDENEE